MKTAGILGGMGPEATAAFYRLVVASTPVTRDQDHIPVVMVADPRIPDRTAYLEGGGKSPLPALIEAVKRLEQAGADFLVIPCNTAHCFWEDLNEAVSIPLLHIMRETVAQVAENASRSSSIAVLGTRGTVKNELYQKELLQHGFSPYLPDAQMQDEVQDLVYRVKGGEPKTELQRRFADILGRCHEEGVGGAILGCTELTLLVREQPSILALYDSVRILAAATVRTATGRNYLSLSHSAAQ